MQDERDWILAEYFSIAVSVGIGNAFGKESDRMDFFEVVEKPFLTLLKEKEKESKKDDLESLIDFLNVKAVNNGLQVLKSDKAV